MIEVLAAFHDATGCDAAVWARDGSASSPLQLIAGTKGAQLAPSRRGSTRATKNTMKSPADRGRMLIVPVRGPRSAWIALGPCPVEREELERYLKFLRPVLAQFLQNAMEVEHAANELAERYEEINLLYSISEILGRTVSLEEGAATILKEVSETVGAHLGAILVHDATTSSLEVIARTGGGDAPVESIALDDHCSVSAHVFRTLHSVIVDERRDVVRRGECLSERRDAHGADSLDCAGCRQDRSVS